MIFPISASLLQHLRKYDEALESFSKPLLKLLTWTVDQDGEMSVAEGSANHHRYVDFTAICEHLYRFIAETVDHQLPSELTLLVKDDAARRAARAVIDMPDRLLDLFVKTCALNQGCLSKAKRHTHFSMLTDEEIAQIEARIAEAVATVSSEQKVE